MPRGTLISAFLTAFAMYSPMFCVPPMEHILKKALFITNAQVSLLFTAPILAMVSAAMPAGLITDRMGPKKVAGIGLIILASGAFLRALAIDASSLLAFTLIYGLGFGLVFPNLPKLVSSWNRQDEAGIPTGVIATGIPLGIAIPLAVSMSLIFPLTNNFRGVFLVWSIPPIAATVMWWLLVKEPQHDSIGYKISSRADISFSQILRHRALWLVAILLLLHTFFTYAWYGWIPALLMTLKQATPELSGLLISITAWVGIPAFFLVPRISHKLGVRRPFLWIPAILLALAAWLAIYVNLPMIWILMVIVGIADAAQFTTLMALPIEIVPKDKVGRASGLVLSIGYVGAIVGPWLCGYIFDLTGGIKMPFFVLSVTSIPAIIIPFWIKETGRKAKSRSE